MNQIQLAPGVSRSEAASSKRLVRIVPGSARNWIRKLNEQHRKKRTSMKTAYTSRLTLLNPRVLIGFALYAAGLVLAFAPMSSVAAEDNAAAELSQSVPAQAPGTWTVTGNLVTARFGHTSTLLPDGQVLVAAGDNFSTGSGSLVSAELYELAPEALDIQ